MKRLTATALVVLVMTIVAVPAWAADDDKGRVTLPSATVTVPNVCNLSLSKAISTLIAAGLKPQTQMSDRDGEARICIRQNPAGGTKVAPGSMVYIYGQLASDVKGKVTLPQ
jgi:beta-lactam-binding protein with PASTA domain